MSMVQFDYIRNLILSPPTKICDISTIYSCLMDEIMKNFKMDIFLVMVIILPILLIFWSYYKRNTFSNVYLVYILGLLIFYIALIFKASRSGFGSELSNLDKKIYNTLKELNGTALSSFSSAALFLLGKNNHVHVYKSDLHKISTDSDTYTKNSLFKSYLTSSNDNSFQNLFKKSNLNWDVKVINDMNPQSNSAFTANENNKNTHRKSNISASNLKENHVEVVLQNESVKNFTTANKNIKKQEKNEDSKPKVEVVVEKQQQNENSKPKVEVVIEKEQNNNSSNIKKGKDGIIEDSDEDVYFKTVLKKLDNEFKSNNKVSENFKDMAKTIKVVESGSKSLENNIKKIVILAGEFDKEFKSFNVSIKSLDNIRIRINSILEKIFPIKHLIDNLNFKESNDKQLNQIFKVDRLDHISDTPYTPKDDGSIIIVLQIILLIELTVALLFFIQLLTNGGTIILGFMMMILLFFNIIFGVIVMLQAHMYDKDCILGKIPNCGQLFSKNFTNFAKSADLDLKQTEIARTDALNQSLSKIETRSNNMAVLLKNLFEEDLLGEFKMQAIQIKNIIDKINFVEDSFKELTHGKIDKSSFYRYVNAVDVGTSQMLQNLAILNRKFLLEFYTKESIFVDYIKNEREKIILNAEKRIMKQQITNKWENKKECARKWKDICYKKEKLDQISLLLIFASFIFMMFFTFL